MNLILNLMSSRTKWVKIEGHVYKQNAAVLYKLEEDTMEVLVISTVYVINGTNVFFKGKCYDLTTYNRHFRAHILTSLNKEICICYDHLHHYIPMHPRKTRALPSDTVIILPFYIS